MTTFKNNIKQNTTLFIGFLILSFGVEKFIFTQPIRMIARTIDPQNGLHIIPMSIMLFTIFILPLRPVRRFIWNSLEKKVNRVNYKSTITESTDLGSANTEVFETIDQKLSNRMSTKKLGENHFMVKIK